MGRLTIGDVVLILGDDWARSNGVRRGVTDPGACPPIEWAELARVALKSSLLQGNGSTPRRNALAPLVDASM